MPEKTIDVLGIVIPDESPLFLAVVAVHVLVALAAVIAGLAAMLATKGGGRHSRFGSIYYWLIFAAFVTTAVLSGVRWYHDWPLFLLGALAIASATIGRLEVRRSRARLGVHLSAMGASYIVLLTAFYVDNGRNLPLWKELPTIAYWTVPTMIGVPIIVWTLLRHPLVAARKRVRD